MSSLNSAAWPGLSDTVTPSDLPVDSGAGVGLAAASFFCVEVAVDGEASAVGGLRCVRSLAAKRRLDFTHYFQAHRAADAGGVNPILRRQSGCCLQYGGDKGYRR